MVSYTDWLFGNLIAGLESVPGLADRTAVFASSDHGDFGGDYHLIEKWPGAADDILTRVPLYARIPKGKASHVVSTQVQSADILETILDLANVKSDYVRFGQSLRTLLEEGVQGDKKDTCVH